MRGGAKAGTVTVQDTGQKHANLGSWGGVQAAVAQLEGHFASHREEADSRNADLHSQLRASHAQVGGCSVPLLLCKLQ